MPIKYVEGDLFAPVPDNGVITIIPHVCNDMKRWGSGFVVPLGKAFPKAKESYLEWEEGSLGHIQFVECSPEVLVANMVAQRDTRPIVSDGETIPPIRYEALSLCMHEVRTKVKELQTNRGPIQIKCPMFGSGLAGGDWQIIEKMIYKIWNEFDVTIYYLPQHLPANFNLNTVTTPVGRTDKKILKEIQNSETIAIESCDNSLNNLLNSIEVIRNNRWPHKNRDCEAQTQDAIDALVAATMKLIALKSTLKLQQENNNV